MMIHEITALTGRHRGRKRIGRGDGSGQGCTAGRGHKGAGSRAGWSRRPGYEGGQMPLFRRIPKRGFSNVQFARRYHVVNLKALEARFEDGASVTPESLVAARVIRDATLPVKILGEGELTRKLAVSASRFSRSAREKIEKAGGSVTELAGPTKWMRAGTEPKKKKKRKSGQPVGQEPGSAKPEKPAKTEKPPKAGKPARTEKPEKTDD